ncbi:MAG: DedA family protein [Planctomycetota bacterium]|nr:DedA family protein [Planctomycetota bacterium]MEC9157096.1 DedA family protein [Planctomycetota bacterium]
MLGVELMFIDWNALLQGSATLYQDAASPAGGADPGALPFTSFIAEYGPWAMIVLLLASGFGVPIGEEVVNIPAGIFVGRGEIEALPVYIAAYVGVLGGDFLWFTLCRTLGKSILHRRWFKRMFHPRRLLEVKHQFDRKGPWVLVVSRFIPGTRSPALTVAGILHMRWRVFVLIELGLCAITTSLQVTIGILIGRELADESISTTIFTALGVVAGIIALTALVTWIVKSRRGQGRPPRAKASWLKKYG